MIVVDANVLLYAHNSESPHHDRARTWLEQALSGAESVGFSWSVIGAFIRISTNHRAFERPLSIAQATGIADSWFASAATVILQPGPEHWNVFSKLLHLGDATGNLVPDAHLAALTIEHGARLLSMDRGFSRFPGLDFTQLPTAHET